MSDRIPARFPTESMRLMQLPHGTSGRRLHTYRRIPTSGGEGTVRELIDGVFGYAANKTILYQNNLNGYLTLFALDETILDKDFRSLSGGEKQRIVIVITLLLERTIFFLDEITAALDNRMKQQVADYFLSHEDWTVLAISHDDTWYREGVRIIPVGDS